MRPGDLVQKNQFAIDEQALSSPEWDRPGIVVKGPYEGSFTVRHAITRKPIMTELKRVVDVMISGKLYKSIPVTFLSRVVMNNSSSHDTFIKDKG